MGEGMLFVGDVAVAPGEQFIHLGFPSRIKRLPMCLNLEGAVLDEKLVLSRGLSNCKRWVHSFDGFQLGPIFIGNNHITDVPGGIAKTLQHLASLKLSYFGAGVSKREAEVVAIDGDLVCVGFGWPVIDCVPASATRAGVNCLEGNTVRRQIEATMREHPERRVVAVFHWQYEFEPYPHPGHRALAMELIDRGVHAVIGHHPHIIGPVERYQGKTIAYSLGNWAFSYGRFFEGTLRFPEESFEQLAVEISTNQDVVHRVRFQPPNTIRYRKAEIVHQPGFSLKPDFEGLSAKEYLRWFKRNRVKRKGLPVYESADASWINTAKDSWVMLRHRLIQMALRTGLKRMGRASP